MKDGLISVAMNEENPKWGNAILREEELYRRDDDIRSEFYRDYNRLLHSRAYRRLKHKTQVFFATRHDHICTRIEHVNHVASISYTIAKELGLNTELALAIATGHDIGHAPFGHAGETCLNRLASENDLEEFWHERNGLFFADKIETIISPKGEEEHLCLTYAVRDGIVSHCGEVNHNSLIPRDDFCDLYSIPKGGHTCPYTWEGCVVKLSDKIAYIGRDIEDAKTLNILSTQQIQEFLDIGRRLYLTKQSELNNTNLIHKLVIDLCNNSCIEKGFCFSDEVAKFLKEIGKYNSEEIYEHKKVKLYIKYINLVIETLFYVMDECHANETHDIHRNIENQMKCYALLKGSFEDWLRKYTNYSENQGFDITNIKNYRKMIIEYISSMTDTFAIRMFNEIMDFS